VLHKHTLTLSNDDVLQILDALQLRAESWENTMRYAKGERTVEELPIEEHSSAREADAIAAHFRNIVHTIETQMNTN